MAKAEPPSGGDPERFEPDAFEDLPAELALARLPAGRHGLPRSFVAHNQRLRILVALLRVLPRQGYANTTIGDVIQEAGVSRAAFYQQFADKEECFLEIYDLASRWLCERVERSAAAEGEWPDRVRAGASEALRLLAGNPALGHLIAVEGLQAGPAGRKRHRACLARLADALRAGRPTRQELPVDLEEMLLGGAISLVARYVETGRTQQLPEVTSELVHYLLVPYLGRRETKRIVDQAA